MAHKCNKIAEISIIKQQVNEMHKALMGNGRAGLIEQWNNFKGGLLFFKIIAGGGGLVGIIALAMVIVN